MAIESHSKENVVPDGVPGAQQIKHASFSKGEQNN